MSLVQLARGLLSVPVPGPGGEGVSVLAPLLPPLAVVCIPQLASPLEVRRLPAAVLFCRRRFPRGFLALLGCWCRSAQGVVLAMGSAELGLDPVPPLLPYLLMTFVVWEPSTGTIQLCLQFFWLGSPRSTLCSTSSGRGPGPHTMRLLHVGPTFPLRSVYHELRFWFPAVPWACD